MEATGTDSEITTTILRQIRDEIVALRSDNIETRKELSAQIAALGEKLDALVRYAKNLTRRMRLGRLEKKVG